MEDDPVAVGFAPLPDEAPDEAEADAEPVEAADEADELDEATSEAPAV